DGVQSQRHRNRHRRGKAAGHLREVPPGGQFRDAPVRRRRSRTLHRQALRRVARRKNLGGDSARPGLDVHCKAPVPSSLRPDDDGGARRGCRAARGGRERQLGEGMKKSTWFCDLRLRLVFLVLLAVIPALVVIFRGAEQQRSALALEAQQNALRTARLVSANQEVLIAGTRQLLTALANAPVVQNGDPGCSAFFHELLEKYPYYSNLAVANSDGWQTCSALSLPTGPVNIADRAYFRRTIER